jgi:excisionase family DNA binding protein
MSCADHVRNPDFLYFVWHVSQATDLRTTEISITCSWSARRQAYAQPTAIDTHIFRYANIARVIVAMTLQDQLRSRTKLLTVPEAADLLAWNKLTLYNTIEAKKFPVVRLGSSSLRIAPATLADWLDKRTG